MKIFGDVFKIFFNLFGGLLKFAVVVLACILVPLAISLGVSFLLRKIRGDKLKKRTVPRKSTRYTKPAKALFRLFVDFPRRIIADIFGKNPDNFDTFGVHIFAGEQGSGKSIAAIHFIKMIKERNPACRIASNISINFQDAELHDWEDILMQNNGELGQVIFLDEIQNWFSSNESRNFPPEMLTEITQQRKQRKCVVGTSQVFTRLAKPIREQISYLYLPFTIAGCLTFVRVYRIRLNEDGTVNNKSMIKLYFFVHDDELRNSYDTFEKVQRLSRSGFKEAQNDITRISPAPVSSSSGFAPVKQTKEKKSS